MRYNRYDESITTDINTYEIAVLNTPEGKSFDILAVLVDTPESGYKMINYRYGYYDMSKQERIQAACDMVAAYEKNLNRKKRLFR